MIRISLFSLVFIVACGGGSSEPVESGGPVNSLAAENFRLPDVNPTSTTFNTDVSPRDQLGNVSGWYFGSAT